MTDSQTLLVPVEVQAMVHNSVATNFVRGAMEYGQLKKFGSPDPPPFHGDDGDAFSTDSRNHGVYLQWTLPDALRNGRRDGSGIIAFPYVPDRWLVIRHYRPAGAQAAPTPEVAAWMVQSDFLDPVAATSAYLDPATGKPTKIGRKVAIVAWAEPGAPAAPFLTAVAEGNPAFATYQPTNQDVFSVFDDLAVQNVEAGSLSYFVLGWYANAAADILADPALARRLNVPSVPTASPADFARLMAALKWTASSLPDCLAATSVYHGAANGIDWDPNGPAPQSPSNTVQPQVAIGCTSIDGIVAFTRAAFSAGTPPPGVTADEAADLIEAFQYQVLDKLALPGAEALVEQEIRSRWFGSSAGGLSWAIVGAPAAPGTAAKPAPPLSSAESKWLDALNATQARYDIAARALAAGRRDLYETWWKSGAAAQAFRDSGFDSYPWNTSPEHFTAALAAATAQTQDRIAALQACVQDARQQPLLPIPAPGQSLEEAAKTFGLTKGIRAELVLKPVAEPRYWTPGDPVVVVSNTAHMLKIEPDKLLVCRWPGEVATGLAATADGPPAAIAGTSMAPFLPAVPLTAMPAVAGALYSEFFLLDPANSAAASAAAGQAVTSSQIAAATPAAPGLAPDIRPSWPWAQAWRPLYLDWRVQWMAVPYEQPDGTSNWDFDGLDFDLAAGFAVPAAEGAPAAFVPISGRAVLTPKPSFEFKSRLDQFASDHAGTPAADELGAVEALIEQVDQGWDFLSQSFGGFGVALAKRRLSSSANPDSATAALLGGDIGPPPVPLQGEQGRKGRAIPALTFEGLRAGQFYVDQLTVVDAFGQTIEVVRSPNPQQQVPVTAKNVAFHPLLADGVAPTRTVRSLEPSRFVQLPPRVLQPARLNFRFTPQANGNPICGWLLPNHLDRSLIIYGADGLHLGDLARAAAADGPELVWTGGPGSPYADGDAGFRAMVGDHGRLGSVLGRLDAAGPDAFDDMLQSIDETLWTVDPLGARGDAFLSVLVGRPLAVVAATLSLELQTPALRDTDWPYTFEPKPPLFLRYKFPVRLGDLGYRQDGLIGYFVDGDFDLFKALHIAENAASAYLQLVRPGNYVKLGFADDGPGTAVDLTMIVDPRGGIHAQCGIVPVKQATLDPACVDGALAAMAVTFAGGPSLAETRSVPLPGGGGGTPALVLTSPAESRGAWSWVERDGSGAWIESSLAAADGNALFCDTRPTLRDGMFKLASGISGE